MQPSRIPPVFWYTVSLCFLALTATIIYIALQSTSVNFEIASQRIELTREVYNLEQIVDELEKRHGDVLFSMIPDPSMVEEADPVPEALMPLDDIGDRLKESRERIMEQRTMK